MGCKVVPSPVCDAQGPGPGRRPWRVFAYIGWSMQRGYVPIAMYQTTKDLAQTPQGSNMTETWASGAIAAAAPSHGMLF